MVTGLGLIALPLLLTGFVIGPMLAAARSPPDWLSAALAAVLGFEALWLVLLARQRDPYFDPDHVTRWEFAARDGNEWLVVVAIVAAAGSGAGLLIGITSRGRWIRHVSSIAAAISMVLVFVASFVLTVGH